MPELIDRERERVRADLFGDAESAQIIETPQGHPAIAANASQTVGDKAMLSVRTYGGERLVAKGRRLLAAG
jgi:hypothetical protein